LARENKNKKNYWMTLVVVAMVPILWRGTGGEGAGKKRGDAREVGVEGAGSGRNRGKLRNIVQHFAIKKGQRSGNQQNRAGTGIKGYTGSGKFTP